MKFLVILALFVVAASAERYIGKSEDPNSPGNCYHKDLKIAIKKGEIVKPTNIGECFELRCQDEGVIRVNECGYYPTFDHCKIFPTDYTKEYPACCAYAKCY